MSSMHIPIDMMHDHTIYLHVISYILIIMMHDHTMHLHAALAWLDNMTTNSGLFAFKNATRMSNMKPIAARHNTSQYEHLPISAWHRSISIGPSDQASYKVASLWTLAIWLVSEYYDILISWSNSRYHRTILELQSPIAIHWRVAFGYIYGTWPYSVQHPVKGLLARNLHKYQWSMSLYPNNSVRMIAIIFRT